MTYTVTIKIADAAADHLACEGLPGEPWKAAAERLYRCHVPLPEGFHRIALRNWRHHPDRAGSALATVFGFDEPTGQFVSGPRILVETDPPSVIEEDQVLGRESVAV